MTQTDRPTPSRIREVDAVRGFALAGILVANIGFLADPGHAITGGIPLPEDPVAYTVNALVLTKFYVIFSFLFGYSFTLQMRAAERAGASVRARTLRRCLGLFVIGVLHGLLLWIGDILTLYAFLGLILLALRDVQPRTAVRIGVWIIGVLTVCYLLLAALTTLDPTAGAAPATDPAEAARVQALATGGALDFLALQVELYPMLALAIWGFQGPTALALFLFGLAAGKSKLLEEPERWAHLLPRIQWVGFGVGVPSAIFYAWKSAGEDATALIALALNNVTSLLLAAAYVATLLRLLKRYPALAGALTPAGRMAASNYIGQSILVCLVFTGYGLALAGSVPPLAVMGIAAVIHTVLLGFSAWWLRSHRYGPVEYGLRRLTNWS
jgi:uncharacterized protein